MREDGDNTQTTTEWEQTTDSQTAAAAAAAGSGAEKTTLPSFSIPSIYYLVVILFYPLPLPPVFQQWITPLVSVLLTLPVWWRRLLRKRKFAELWTPEHTHCLAIIRLLRITGDYLLCRLLFLLIIIGPGFIEKNDDSACSLTPYFLFFFSLLNSIIASTQMKWSSVRGWPVWERERGFCLPLLMPPSICQAIVSFWSEELPEPESISVD